MASRSAPQGFWRSNLMAVLSFDSLSMTVLAPTRTGRLLARGFGMQRLVHHAWRVERLPVDRHELRPSGHPFAGLRVRRLQRHSARGTTELARRFHCLHDIQVPEAH